MTKSVANRKINKVVQLSPGPSTRARRTDPSVPQHWRQVARLSTVQRLVRALLATEGLRAGDAGPLWIELTWPYGPGMSTKTVGLVLSGGGARGAYEAGALSVLLPQMASADEGPTRLVGTSAGALNVVALAGLAQDGWVAATTQLRDWWSTVRFADIGRVPSSAVKDIGSYVSQVIGGKAELLSLLDTRPMRNTLNERLPMEAMHKNIRDGLVDAVAVATTSASTGSTVVFVEAASGVPVPRDDPRRNIRYVATKLTVDHVLASAAVPVAFRPVLLPGHGWCVDGGVRLNTPLKPALKLGCDHVAVVATHPRTWTKQSGDGAPPDVFGAASLLLKAVLVDHMLEDLRTLVRTNEMVDAAASSKYRTVAVRFVGPPTDQAHVIADQTRKVRPSLLTDSDVWLLEHLLGGTAGERAELLSYLLFDPAFTSALGELGAKHARHSTGWRTSM